MLICYSYIDDLFEPPIIIIICPHKNKKNRSCAYINIQSDQYRDKSVSPFNDGDDDGMFVH